MLATLRTAAPLVSRTTFRAFASKTDHKVQTLLELKDVENFRKENAKSVLYFTAVWCPPCKQIKPVYHEMSNTTEKVAFGLVDVDDNGDAAVEFKISAVPTFIFSDGEKTLQQFSGADPNQLAQLVKNLESQ